MPFDDDDDLNNHFSKVHRRYELLEKLQAKYDFERQAHRLYQEEVLKEKTLQRTLSQIFMNTGRLPAVNELVS